MNDKALAYRGLHSRLIELLQAVQAARPNDRSEMDRHFAIVITDFEKVIASYEAFILKGESKLDYEESLFDGFTVDELERMLREASSIADFGIARACKAQLKRRGQAKRSDAKGEA